MAAIKAELPTNVIFTGRHFTRADITFLSLHYTTHSQGHKLYTKGAVCPGHDVSNPERSFSLRSEEIIMDHKNYKLAR